MTYNNHVHLLLAVVLLYVYSVLADTLLRWLADKKASARNKVVAKQNHVNFVTILNLNSLKTFV